MSLLTLTLGSLAVVAICGWIDAAVTNRRLRREAARLCGDVVLWQQRYLVAERQRTEFGHALRIARQLDPVIGQDQVTSVDRAKWTGARRPVKPWGGDGEAS